MEDSHECATHVSLKLIIHGHTHSLNEYKKAVWWRVCVCADGYEVDRWNKDANLAAT